MAGLVALSLLSWAGLSAVGTPAAQADGFADGGVHDVDYIVGGTTWIEDGPSGQPTTVNLLPDGVIESPQFWVYDHSILNVVGGSIGHDLFATDDSSVVITSGSLTRIVGAGGSAHVSIFGGAFPDNGGVLGGYLGLSGDAVMTVYGQFNLPYGEYQSLGAFTPLTGWLSSGEYINMPVNMNGGTLKLIPEPVTLSVLALGGLAMLRRRRGMRVCASILLAYAVLVGGPSTQAQAAPVLGPTGNYYEYVSGALTWGQALAAAESRSYMGWSGHLVTVTSQEENEFVSSIALSGSWLAASDQETEGTWEWMAGPELGEVLWSDGTAIMYCHWDANEPNNMSGNENWAEIHPNNGRWNDVLPDTTRSYVAEYEVPEPATLGLLAMGGLVLIRRRRTA